MTKHYITRYLVYGLVLVLAACQQRDQGHAHTDSGGHSHGEEAHDHQSGRPSVKRTVWTQQAELFVEYPALVAGETSRFATHITRMDGHQPLQNGKVTVSLIQGKKGIRQTATSPSSPGIFTPALQPSEAGWYKLTFTIQSADLSEKITLDSVRVFATAAEASEAIGHAHDEGIAFTKEQAWKTDFQTAIAKRKPIYEVIHTSGTWQTSPADYQTLVASASGVIHYSGTGLTDGSQIRKGQTLATLSTQGLTSNNLVAAQQKAKARLDQSQAAYERKKKLKESDIVPGAELEQARLAYEVALADYRQLSRGMSGSGKQLIAPFDGYISHINSRNGDYVEEGAPILSVSRQEASVLKANLSPQAGVSQEAIRDMYYQPSDGQWSRLMAHDGKVLSVAREVEATQPLLAVYASVNEPVAMPKGSFTEVQLVIGDPREAIVIPASALLEDYGQYAVMVQTTGEMFERRNILIGRRNGEEVEVTSGLKAGEVVVSTGAFQVKMASMSGQAPAHGHAH